MAKEDHEEKVFKSKNRSSSSAIRSRRRPKSGAEVVAALVAYQRWKRSINPLIDKMGNVSIGEPSSPNPPTPPAASASTTPSMNRPLIRKKVSLVSTAAAAAARTPLMNHPSLNRPYRNPQVSIYHKEPTRPKRNQIDRIPFTCRTCRTLVQIFKDGDKGYRIWNGDTTKCVPRTKVIPVYCRCGKGGPYTMPSYF